MPLHAKEYSSRSRGKWEEEEHLCRLAPDGWKEKHEVQTESQEVVMEEEKSHKHKISDDSVWHSLIIGLSDLLQLKLLRCLIRNDPKPVKEDWQNVLLPSSHVTTGRADGLRKPP